jgi:hypothetical protein
VDKINQFAAELGNPATNALEQLLALKFLLYFVGDVHQPLHAADDHDAGGNKKLVVAGGLHPGNLHHYWDVEFVERPGTDPRQVTASLIGQISETQRQEWSSGKPADWAMEAFALARGDAYGQLPAPSGQSTSSLARAYVDQALPDVALQLSRAGVRLALVLNLLSPHPGKSRCSGFRHAARKTTAREDCRSSFVWAALPPDLMMAAVRFSFTIGA